MFSAPRGNCEIIISTEDNNSTARCCATISRVMAADHTPTLIYRSINVIENPLYISDTVHRFSIGPIRVNLGIG
jgi:hypothetical protein